MEREKQPASVGTFEAKTHLSALLERVAKGETITITRNGVPDRQVGAPDQPAPAARG